MFPLAFGPGNVLHRALRPDDIAGVSDLYPEGGFEDDTGSISGRVTKNGQRPVRRARRRLQSRRPAP